MSWQLSGLNTRKVKAYSCLTSSSGFAILIRQHLYTEMSLNCWAYGIAAWPFTAKCLLKKMYLSLQIFKKFPSVTQYNQYKGDIIPSWTHRSYISLYWSYYIRFCQYPCTTWRICTYEPSHIEAETKWPSFSIQHFQMDFLERKCMNF